MDELRTEDRPPEARADLRWWLGETIFFLIAVDSELHVVAAAGRHPELLCDLPLPEPGLNLAEQHACPELVTALRQAIDGEESIQVVELQGRRTVIYGMTGGHNGRRAAVGLCVDLHAATAEVHRREVQLRLLLRQLPVSVWITDRQLRIREAAGSVLSRVGIDPGQAVGRSVEEMFGTHEATDPDIAHHRQALAGQATRYQRKNGRALDVLLEPLRDGDQVVGVVGVAIDATEHVAREERLRRSERALAEAQRMAHLGSWEWMLGTDRVEWSAETYRIYGLARGQFAGTYNAFLALAHPEDRGYVSETILNGLREEQPFTYDHRILRSDGEVRRLHTRGEVMLDEQGRPVRMLGCCWDITERWVAERKLARSVSLLQATLESTTDGILVVDRDGKIGAHNRRFVELWRLPDDVLAIGLDQAALDVVQDQLEDFDSFIARVRELYGQPDMESYDVVHFKDGRVFERYSRPQRIGDEVVGRVWSFRDVTEREHLLRRAVFLSDASRLLGSLEVERATEAVAHLAVPAFADSCALDLFSDEGGPRRLFVVTNTGSPTVLDELPRPALNGHSLLYEAGGRSCLAAPLLARDALIGVLSFAAPGGRRFGPPDLDLAEELARRIALALDNARLYRGVREALHARDEFLSVAAHELRGPATSLRLAVQSMRAGEVPETMLPRTLDLCERQVKKIARFIDELLDVSRLRAGLLQLEMDDVDLAAATRDVASNLSHELSRSGSSLSISGDARVEGRWDRTRIEQLVTNLLSNAIKFGQGRPITMTVRNVDGKAVLEVRDHGIGIARDRQKTIFEPFERAVSARHYGGLGLGLYICRSITEALGGSLIFDSEPGQGSTFTVTLPQTRTA